MSLTDTEWPFTFKRRQFSVRLSFALTINKPLGQTLPKGQLYVAVSRVRSMLGQNVLTLNKEDEPHGYIKNVVYKEVLNEV